MSVLTEAKRAPLTKLELRERIFKFESVLAQHPGAIFGNSDLCPLKHTFAPGMYIREIFIPAGTMLTGKIHRHTHPRFLLSGTLTVVTESGGVEHMTGPLSLISLAGSKRVVYAHTDVVSVTVHHNPDNITDLEKLEEMIIAPDYESLEKGTECHSSPLQLA
jgi:hypothetical protein